MRDLPTSEHNDYVFGLHAVAALLDDNPAQLARLWIQQSPRSTRLAELSGKARRAGIRVEAVERRWLDRKLGNNQPHQGVLALQQVRPLADSAALLARVRDQLAEDPAQLLLLLLDELQDTRNLGACLRSAEGAGVTAVVVPKRRSAPVNALARRTAAGAADRLFIAGVANMARTIEDLQALGVWVYATTDRAAMDYTQADLTAPCALVLGNEERGVRRLVQERSDGQISLPMQGKVSSLNVSVACGIVLYEALRQRRAKAQNGPAGGAD